MNYTTEKNNQDHQLLLNRLQSVDMSVNNVDIAMVKEGINGAIAKAMVLVKEQLVLMRQGLEKHAINTVELGKSEYGRKIKHLEQENEKLKETVKSVSKVWKTSTIVTTIGLFLALLKIVKDYYNVI